MAEERTAALETLVKAMAVLYPDQDPPVLQAAALSMAGALPTADHIRSLAADATELFPADFANLRVKTVLKAFAAAREEKGLA